MNYISIGKTRIPYRISWSKKRKTIGVSISQKSEVIIRAPKFLSSTSVKDKIKTKKPWILEKIDKKGIKIDSLKKDFLSGEKLLYKGRRYKLKVKEKNSFKKAVLNMEEGKFILRVPQYSNSNKRREEILHTVKCWYQKQAEKYLTIQTKEYARSLDFNLESVKIKSYKSNWGLTKGNKIYYNWKVILLPVSIQNYIVAHEVAHLEISKHSDKFWNLVGTMVPDYENKLERLDKNRV